MKTILLLSIRLLILLVFIQCNQDEFLITYKGYDKCELPGYHQDSSTFYKMNTIKQILYSKDTAIIHSLTLSPFEIK